MSQKGKKAAQDNPWGKQEEPLQAVVVADSFNERFSPITKEMPRALLPLVNKTLLDFTLEYLVLEGVQEIFVFCCAHSEQLKEHIRKNWSSVTQCTIHTLTSSSQDCISLGDALREIDREGLIRSDFLLVPGDIVSNVKLQTIIQEHKERRKKEKTCMMTLLYRTANPGHFSRCKEDDLVAALDPTTQRILYCQKAQGARKFLVPLGLFSNRNSVDVRYDLSDTHICICSPMVPALFTDNFDYQTKDDFIRGILINEEIMGNQLHAYIIEEGYSARVSDLHLYNAVSQDVMNRWSYPLVPDNGPYHFSRHNIYYGEEVRLDRDIQLDENVVIGKGTTIGSGSFVMRSVIGSDCKIGERVKIINSFIWDNVVIEDDSTIEHSVVCTDCLLKRGVTLKDSLASFKVVLGPNVSVPPSSKISLLQQDKLDDYIETLQISDDQARPNLAEIIGSEGRGYLWEDEDEETIIPGLRGDYCSDTDDESSDDSIPSATASPQVEPSNLFYNEVLENVRHGVIDKITPDNIILEVNASKYKYNVTIREINQSIVRALLEVAVGDSDLSTKEARGKFNKISTDYQELISNYIRGDESQLHCITAIEEYFAEHQQKNILFPTILHTLYEKDMLDEAIILSWYKKPPMTEDLALEVKCNNLRLNQSLKKFIIWLEEAEEESDSDDSS